MTLALTLEKGSKLAKLSKEVRSMSTRCQRAFDRYNERMARAQADLKEELREAVLGDIDVEETGGAEVQSA